MERTTTTDDPDPTTAARSLLFVPGTRPDRFEKARASGADVVILDLEDAVEPEAKEQARDHVGRYLADADHRAVVRVNPAGTPWHDDDLAALAGAPGLLGVMIPKCVTAEDVAAVRRVVAGPVIPLLETAAGVEAAADVARADGVARLALGDQDLLADLGAESGELVTYARLKLAYASAAAGLPGPIDGVSLALRDADVVRSDTERAHGLGFTGKLCVHPAQVAAVNDAFAPDEEAIAWARRILSSDGDGVRVGDDGTMVDAPVLQRARNILAAAGSHDSRDGGR